MSGDCNECKHRVYLPNKKGKLIGSCDTLKCKFEEKRGAEIMGFWILDVDRDDKTRTWDWRRFVCSDCGKWNTYGETPFCPYCGKPKKVKESEK